MFFFANAISLLLNQGRAWPIQADTITSVLGLRTLRIAIFLIRSIQPKN